MPTPPLRQPIKAESILVFRALMLGDMLCAVPALRALRAAFPAARITLAGLPWARELRGWFPRYITDFIAFPGFPGLPEGEVDAAAYGRFVDECRARRFDVAVQMHGDGRLTNGIVRGLGAVHSYGFHPGGTPAPQQDGYLAWPEDGHEINRLLKLTEFLGAPRCGDQLEFPLDHADTVAFFHRDDTRPLRRGEYVCIHPGARLASRRWPPERFARVADALIDLGLTVVLTGAGAERQLNDEVAARMRGPVLNLAGRTTLHEAAALLRHSRLVVCNDTGVSHLAAAVGARSLVLVTGSDPRRWAPLRRRRHAVLYHPVGCRPCTYDQCPIGHRCATSLSVPEVTAAARRMAAARRRTEAPPVLPTLIEKTRPICGPFES